MIAILHLLVALALILVGTLGAIQVQNTRAARRPSGFAFYAAFIVGVALLVLHNVRYAEAWGPQAAPFEIDCKIVRCAIAQDAYVYRR